MSGAKYWKRLDWINTFFLVLTPACAGALSLIFFKFHGWQWSQVGLALLFYFLTGLSITGGYHRLFSHRTYRTNTVVKIFYLLFGAAAFENSALKWSADHRQHHRHVDHAQDPYNINKGFFYAHIGWIFFKEEERAQLERFPKDLTSDKWVMWQHKYYLIIAVLMGLVLPALIGHLLGSALGGLALAGVLRLVVVHHCTFLINSLCHVIGSRPYSDKNSARDSAVMAFFTYGEGYHNYHHNFPTDYRNGIKWYQFDPTKWMIKALSYCGLAEDLKKVPKNLIEKAREEMKAKEFSF